MENTPQPSSPTLIGALTTLIVPVVVIVGIVILMALHDVDATAGIALISALAGLHGGAAVVKN